MEWIRGGRDDVCKVNEKCDVFALSRLFDTGTIEGCFIFETD